MIGTEDNLGEFVKQFNISETVVFDIEATGLNVHGGDKMIGIAVYFPDVIDTHFDTSWYLPFRHEQGKNLSSDFLKELSTWFFGLDKQYWAFNMKFDLQFLHVGDGFVLPDNCQDVKIMSHLLNENKYAMGLKELGEQCLKREPLAEQALFDAIRVERKRLNMKKLTAEGKLKGMMAMLPPELVAPYAIEDVHLTWDLYKFFLPLLEEYNNVDLFYEMCNDYVLRAILPAEIRGIDINRPLLENEIIRLTEEERMQLYYIHSHYPGMNPGSWQQVRKNLGVSASDATFLKNFSTRGDKSEHKVAKMVVDIKALRTSIGYLKQYLEWSEVDGKVHGSFNAARTSTSRLSSANPNMQNVPTMDKGLHRQAFIAPFGWLMLENDWDRLEMFMAAHYANQINLLNALASDADVHQLTADKLGISRAAGKIANFSLMYGMGWKRFLERYWDLEGMNAALAKKIVNGWRELYPEITEMVWAMQEQAATRYQLPNSDRHTQYTALWTGRCRHWRDANPYSYKDNFNFLIQGSGSEFNRKLIQWLQQFGYMQSVNFVHDSAFVLVRVEDVHRAAAQIRAFEKVIQNPPYLQLKVPLTLGVKVGYNWGDLEEYDVEKNYG